MIIDTYSLEDGHSIESDICIVGSGLAGMTVAKEFLDTKLHICLLEAGDIKPNRQSQLFHWGENIGHPYYSLDTARPRCLGGSVNRWFLKAADILFTAQMRPLDAIDFHKRDWVSDSGWPFQKSDLQPYYRRAQQLCGIEPPTFDIPQWSDTKDRPVLPFDDEYIQTVLFKFTSKSDFLENHLKDIINASNIDTYINANVTDIVLQPDSNHVARLRVANLNGHHYAVKSKVFILASGALEIVRLMLNSNEKVTCGIGNENDLVGRYFMEHPHCTIGLTVPPSKGVFHQTRFYNDVQRVSNTPVIAKLCLSESRMRSHRLLNQVIDLTPKVIPQAEISKYPLIDTAGIHALKEIRKHGLRTPQLKHHLGIAAKDAYNIYRAVYRMHKAWLWKIFIKANVNTYHLLSVSEQVPNPNSRVTLTKEKDQLGMQRIALDWQLTAQDMDSIHQTVKHMDDGFRQIGLGKIFIRIYNTLPNPAIRGGWHHMGTTRMHRHPYKGVVDPDCKIHTMQNLYIAGPSVFPTGGYANPSLTVVALAIRLADHIKHNFQAGEY